MSSDDGYATSTFEVVSDPGESTNSARILRACDQCRRRKVRCHEATPCTRCKRSSLHCTRNDQTRRRGPKPGSGSVIMGLRALGCSSPFDTANRRLVQPHRESVQRGEPTSAPRDLLEEADSSATPLNFPELSSRPHSTDLLDSQDDVANSDGVETMKERGINMYHDIGSIGIAVDAAGSPVLTEQSFLLSPSDQLHNATIGASGSELDCQQSYLARNKRLSPLTTLPMMSNYVPAGVLQAAQHLEVSPMVIDRCIGIFFERLFPVMPVVRRNMVLDSITRQLGRMNECVLVSLCAITVLRSATIFEQSWDSRHRLTQRMIQRCQELRRGFAWLSHSSAHTVIVSYLVSLCCFDLQQSAAQRHYLREAVEMFKELETEQPALDYPDSGLEECHRYLRDLLYITEVSSAIQRPHQRRSSSLNIDDTHGPSHLENPIARGISSLLQLFTIMDQSVLRCANCSDHGSDSTQCQALMTQAQQNLSAMACPLSHPSQRADIAVSIQWARLMVWNTSVSHGLVSSAATEPAFRYDFPFVVSRALCDAIQSLAFDDIATHGLGIVSPSIRVSSRYKIC